MYRALFFVAATALVVAPVAAKDRSIRASMAALVGLSADEVFAKLGQPTLERRTPGHKVYAWRRSWYQAGPNVPPAPLSLSSTIYQCTVYVVINSANRVEQADGAGDREGCKSYQHRLDRDS